MRHGRADYLSHDRSVEGGAEIITCYPLRVPPCKANFHVSAGDEEKAKVLFLKTIDAQTHIVDKGFVGVCAISTGCLMTPYSVP